MSNSRHRMQTYTGRPFRFDDLAETIISLSDISRPLSRIPRFAGHCGIFISVAEHSIVVSKILAKWGYPKQLQLYGLLHDAHEAFTGDIVAPLKRYIKDVLHFDIEPLQDAIQSTIHTNLGIGDDLSKADKMLIGEADRYACRIERSRFMASSLEWDIDYIEIDQNDFELYTVMHPQAVMRAFEDLFYNLSGLPVHA